MAPNCEDASSLAQSLSLQIALCFKTVFCFVAVLCAVYGAIRQGISWLAHPNAKALFCFHTFWAVYLPFCYCFDCGFDAIRLIMFKDRPCDLLISTSLAVPFRAIPVLGLVAQSFTMCAFSLERAMATFSPKSYEKIKKPWIGIILGLTAFILALFEELMLIVLPNDWTKKIPLSAIRTNENADYYVLFLHSYSIIEFSTITTFVVCLYINNQRSRTTSRYQKGLANKYQVSENKHIIKTLLPCFCVHFVVNIIPMLGLQFYLWLFEYNFVAFTTWVEWSVQMHMYSIIMPIVLQVKLHCRKSRRITDVNNAETYHDHLKTMFDKPLPT